MNVETKQQRIAELAKQYSQVGLNNLHHYMDVDWLKEAYRRLDRQSAPGIDGQSAEQYGEELESNLRDLLNRAKRQNLSRAAGATRVGSERRERVSSDRDADGGRQGVATGGGDGVGADVRRGVL